MKVRFLPFLMLPILGMAQANSNGEVPLGGNTSSERQTLETKRNASFNLEEIKVRWKKAALENCPGVPCIVTPPPPPPPSFTCGTSTVTDFNGNLYETVAIVGTTQCWTKTNLKVINYNDGTLIPDLTTSTSNPWAPTSGARTEYVAAGVAGYVGTFGYLYNWYAVTDSRKLCPDGWRVPTDSDWNKLVISLHSGTTVADTSSTSLTQSTTAGTALKSTVTNSSYGSGLGWNPGSPGTNTSGFTALPGGFRNVDGSFGNISYNAYFWSATESGSIHAWYRYLSSFNGDVYRGIGNKTFGASVRCLRD